MTYFHGDEAKKIQNSGLKKTEFFNIAKSPTGPNQPKFQIMFKKEPTARVY